MTVNGQDSNTSYTYSAADNSVQVGSSTHVILSHVGAVSVVDTGTGNTLTLNNLPSGTTYTASAGGITAGGIAFTLTSVQTVNNNAAGTNALIANADPQNGTSFVAKYLSLAIGTGITFNYTPSIQTLTVNGGAGNDTLTADYSAGNPVPSSGLSFAGGGGTNTF